MAQSNNTYAAGSARADDGSQVLILRNLFSNMLININQPDSSMSLLDIFGIEKIPGNMISFPVADLLQNMGTDITVRAQKNQFVEEFNPQVNSELEVILKTKLIKNDFFIHKGADDRTAARRGKQIYGNDLPSWVRTMEYERSFDALSDLAETTTTGALKSGKNRVDSQAFTIQSDTVTNTKNKVVYGDGTGTVQFLNAGHILGCAGKANQLRFDEFLVIVPKVDWDDVVGDDIFSNAEDRTLSNWGLDNSSLAIRGLVTYTARPGMGVLPIDSTVGGFNTYTVSNSNNIGTVWAINTMNPGLKFGCNMGAPVVEVNTERNLQGDGIMVRAYHNLGAVPIGYNVIGAKYKSGDPSITA